MQNPDTAMCLGFMLTTLAYSEYTQHCLSNFLSNNVLDSLHVSRNKHFSLCHNVSFEKRQRQILAHLVLPKQKSIPKNQKSLHYQFNENGKNLTEQCFGFNPTSFFALGTTSTEEGNREIKSLTFDIVPEDKIQESVGP
jgi:hypothetical protein